MNTAYVDPWKCSPCAKIPRNSVSGQYVNLKWKDIDIECEQEKNESRKLNKFSHIAVGELEL